MTYDWILPAALEIGADTVEVSAGTLADITAEAGVAEALVAASVTVRAYTEASPVEHREHGHACFLAAGAFQQAVRW